MDDDFYDFYSDMTMASTDVGRYTPKTIPLSTDEENFASAERLVHMVLGSTDTTPPVAA